MATVGEYLNWLRTIGGECKFGIGADPNRGMVPIIKLISPNGKYVIHSGNDQSEKLSRHIIEYYDRRLEVVSPFKAVPRA